MWSNTWPVPLLKLELVLQKLLLLVWVKPPLLFWEWAVSPSKPSVGTRQSSRIVPTQSVVFFCDYLSLGCSLPNWVTLSCSLVCYTRSALYRVSSAGRNSQFCSCAGF